MDPTDIPPSRDPDEPTTPSSDEPSSPPPAEPPRAPYDEPRPYVPFESSSSETPPVGTGSDASPYAYGDAPAVPEAPKRGKIAVLGLAIALALVAAGTFVAVRSGTKVSSLDTMVPSDAIAFASAQIRPSGSQGDAVRSLLGRLPQSTRDEITEGFKRQLDDGFSDIGLNYEKDVEPWLGDTFAVSVRAPAEGSTRGPIVVGLLEVTDDAAARSAFQRGKADEEIEYLVQDGVAYLADEMVDITSLRSAVQAKGALSSNPSYTKEAATVGDALAMAWFDAGALQKQLGGVLGGGIPGMPFGTQFNQFGQQTSGFAAVGLRATGDGIELFGHGTADGDQPAPKTGALKLVESAPASIIGALSITNPAAVIEAAEQILSLFAGGFGATVAARPVVQESPLDLFGDANPLEQLGISLENDLLPWLEGELSVVVGGISVPPVPDMGVLIEPTDEAAAKRTLDKLQSNLGKMGLSVQPTSNGFTVNAGFVTVAVVQEPGRIIIASSPAYARTLAAASPESLGDDAVYQRTFGSDATQTAAQVYLRLDRLQSIIETVLPADERASYEKDAKPFLDELQSLGIRVTASGNESTFSLKLLVRE